MENQIALQNQWTQSQIDTLRQTVAAGANDNELQMFLHLASKYQLDPFAKELFFIQVPTKNGNRNTIMTSRDGYLSIAERNPHFRGMDSDAVYENDSFSKNKDGVAHSYKLNNRGALIGAYAVVYRDDRNIPSYFFAPIQDYQKDSQVWRQYPHAMIIKVAEAMALKRAFSISGLTTQEELQNDNNVSVSVKTVAKSADTPLQNPDEKTMQKMKQYIWTKFLTHYEAKTKDKEEAIAQAKTMIQFILGNDKPSADWNVDDLKELDEYIKKYILTAGTPEKNVTTPDESTFNDVEIAKDA